METLTGGTPSIFNGGVGATTLTLTSSCGQRPLGQFQGRMQRRSAAASGAGNAVLTSAAAIGITAGAAIAGAGQTAVRLKRPA